MPRCTFPGCDKTYYAKGWCGMHYQRVQDHGTPLGGPKATAPPHDRFMRRVRKDPSGCWLFGSGEAGGYPNFQIGGKGSRQQSAHRYSYILHHGEIPEGMVVMHACDNPRCVNPDHLSVGTHQQNTDDMIAKGRKSSAAPVGVANGKSLLDPDKVRMIRASTETNKALADRLGVSVNTVRGVRIGRTWAHIP